VGPVPAGRREGRKKRTKKVVPNKTKTQQARKKKKKEGRGENHAWGVVGPSRETGTAKGPEGKEQKEEKNRLNQRNCGGQVTGNLAPIALQRKLPCQRASAVGTKKSRGVVSGRQKRKGEAVLSAGKPGGETWGTLREVTGKPLVRWHEGGEKKRRLFL